MGKALLFGLGAGLAIQGWRQFPPDGPVTPNGAALIAVVACVVAYLVGRARRKPGATAIATATAVAAAEATAVQNVQVFVAGQHVPTEQLAGGAIVAKGIRVPSSEVSWGSTPRAALTDGELEGFDLAELIEEETEQA